ncbi:MAG TPA: CBS domain-containing protein [Actinomycetota bacterium]|nr:CBS domain-containing protein [Actinomycetota bacterium]
MRASDVMREVVAVGPSDPAEALIEALRRPEVRAVTVVSAEGEVLGLVTDEDLLYALLPPYVVEDESVAAALERDCAGELRRRLRGRRVQEVLNFRRRAYEPVGPRDSLVQVAASIVRAGDPAVLVVEGDRILGVVTVDALLPALVGEASR